MTLFSFGGTPLKSFYLVISHSGSWLSQAIRVCSRAPYSHVSITFDLSLQSLYSFGRLNPNNPFIGGFTIESIDGGIFKRFKETTCQIYMVRTTDEKYEDLRRRIQYFIDHKDE